MYFDKDGFKKSVTELWSLLPLSLTSNWGNNFLEFISNTLNNITYEWFGGYLNQARKWLQYKPKNLLELFFKIILFFWVLVVQLMKTCGIPFKIVCWLVLSPFWFLVAFCYNTKFTPHSSSTSSTETELQR